MMKECRIVVTGSAGFIGFHLCQRLLSKNFEVIGVDNYTPYYSVRMKNRRTELLTRYGHFSFHNVNLHNRSEVENFGQKFLADSRDTIFIHLAAQPGVRYSKTNPESYVESNLVGFVNVLELIRKHGTRHFIFASSSSVYGNTASPPYSEDETASHPLSLYAATKRSNELIAHAYSHTYGVPCTGLRFFTVYGPWGRPDMAVFDFSRRILRGEPIVLYEGGELLRDFTYISDIIDGLVGVILGDPPRSLTNVHVSSPVPPSVSTNAFRIFNIGNCHPESVNRLVGLLEMNLGRSARIVHSPIEKGDVQMTAASVDKLAHFSGFHPRTSLENGVEMFCRWLLDEGISFLDG